MAWYLRLYKLGPYKGLPEKAVGARGAPNFLQADEDSIDDADYLAIGRVANHGLMGKEVRHHMVGSGFYDLHAA
jgi:hypothetical protein